LRRRVPRKRFMSRSVPTAIPSSPGNKNFWIPLEGSSGLIRSMARRVRRAIDSTLRLPSLILRLRSGQAAGVCLRPETSASRSTWKLSRGSGQALSGFFLPRLQRQGLSLSNGSIPPISFLFPRLQGSVRKRYYHNYVIPTYLFLEIGIQH
jgi:hypothetical protein